MQDSTRASSVLPTRRPWFVWAAAATCAVALAACGPSTGPLMLELRSAESHVPLAGAAVEADSLALGPSLRPSDIVDELLKRRVAFSSRGRTDTFGRVMLEHIPGRAVRLTILVPDHSPAFAVIESRPGWQSTMGSASGTPYIEFMCYQSAELRPASN